MENEIKEIIEVVKFNAELAANNSMEILAYSKDMFIKHKANEIKNRAEDTLRLLPALEQLINSIET
jgi:hypothetical protein